MSRGPASWDSSVLVPLCLALRQRWREILPAERIRELAQHVLVTTDLRAADALQLAAALVWCREKPRQRLFLTSGHRLGSAARGAGFDVVPR